MQKLLGIIFILLYGIEILLCPLQDFASLKCLPQIYSQCTIEDPDMDAADFVFEHLMNLESVFSCFDKDYNEHKNERPHQPSQQLQSISQTLVVINKPLQIETEDRVFFPNAKITYTVDNGDFLPSIFLVEVFRPPSV